jgi:hypothetical protein
MMRKLLLIDYENIQNFDLTCLENDVDVVVFVGATQKISPSLAAAAARMGDRLVWLKMSGTGPNALDFHIACYLGRTLEIDHDHICYILSHDKGFDPLLDHLGKFGLECFRIDNLAPLGIDLSPTEEASYRKVVDTLRKQRKPQRPHTRAALIRLVASTFQRRPDALQVNSIIFRLMAKKLLYIHDDTVTYG